MRETLQQRLRRISPDPPAAIKSQTQSQKRLQKRAAELKGPQHYDLNGYRANANATTSKPHDGGGEGFKLRLNRVWRKEGGGDAARAALLRCTGGALLILIWTLVEVVQTWPDKNLFDVRP